MQQDRSGLHGASLGSVPAYPASQGSEMLEQSGQSQHLDGAAAVVVEEASPISSRPPLVQANFHESEAPNSGDFPDEAHEGDDAQLGYSVPGNRWPRQETLALLKIRSDMDADFKEAGLKGPLWEHISRKMAELGYCRTAKKCKEKFENVQKYYKRTKEGRAGRSDSKNYKFSSQLEALQSSSMVTEKGAIAVPAVPISVALFGTNPIADSSSTDASIPTEGLPPQRPALAAAPPSGAARLSFSLSTSSSSRFEEDEDGDGEEDKGDEEFEKRGIVDPRKRKRMHVRVAENKRMMAFFEMAMKEVMEKQEGMMMRFIENLERREQDRMVREEAWRRQEMARLAREREITTQERAISASRDATLIAFLQQITGNTVQIITQLPITMASPSPAPPPPPLPSSSSKSELQQRPQFMEPPVKQRSAQPTEIVLHQQERSHPSGTLIDLGHVPSRWPKVEVLALIKLRTKLASRYLEPGPKGHLWEEISAGMHQLGYRRSAKRCKEKWENINKYFKKVKDSNKTRPEDARTCPYFHELDALHRSKVLEIAGIADHSNRNSSFKAQQSSAIDAIAPPPAPSHPLAANGTGAGNHEPGNNPGSGASLQTGNGNLPFSNSIFSATSIKDEFMGGDSQHHSIHSQDNHHHTDEEDDGIADIIDEAEEEDDGVDEDETDDEDQHIEYKIDSQGNSTKGAFLAVSLLPN